MRLLLAIIVACLVMSGCEKKDQGPSQAAKDVEVWKSLCAREKADGEKLQSALNAERAANADWPKKFQAAQEQIDQLKAQVLSERTAAAQQIASLKSQLDGAKSAAAALADMVSASGKPASGDRSAQTATVGQPGFKPPAATAPEIAAAEKTVADLDSRIKTLQPKLGQCRSKTAELARAKVDQRMIPPPNGGIHQHGGEERIHNFEGNDIGPAIKRGDFRTQLDKDEAVRTAKQDLLPMEQELRALQDELAAAKAKLAKLRAGQTGR
jgi:hypothetical protein